jgi:hypothetical protein
MERYFYTLQDGGITTVRHLLAACKEKGELAGAGIPRVDVELFELLFKSEDGGGDNDIAVGFRIPDRNAIVRALHLRFNVSPPWTWPRLDADAAEQQRRAHALVQRVAVVLTDRNGRGKCSLTQVMQFVAKCCQPPAAAGEGKGEGKSEEGKGKDGAAAGVGESKSDGDASSSTELRLDVLQRFVDGAVAELLEKPVAPRPEATPPPPKPSTWVGDWLDAAGLKDFVEEFEKQGLTTKDVLCLQPRLTVADLEKTLGVRTLADQRKVFALLSKLWAEVDAAPAGAAAPAP